MNKQNQKSLKSAYQKVDSLIYKLDPNKDHSAIRCLKRARSELKEAQP